MGRRKCSLSVTQIPTNGDILGYDKNQKLRPNQEKGSWSSGRESWAGGRGGERKEGWGSAGWWAEQSRVEGAAGSAISGMLITGLCRVV